MNIKSLLLGSAAALVAVSGARAADAVVAAEPEPVEYVRVCDMYGAGYFYIPGTETCLKFSGYIRNDISGGDLLDSPEDSYNWSARFTLDTSTKNETEYGTLEGFAEMRFNFANGGGNGLAVNTTTIIPGVDDDGGNTGIVGDSTSDITGASETTLDINQAWISLAGFQVGKTETAFVRFGGAQSYVGNIINDTLVPYGPFETLNIQYTADFGGGFGGIIALEEGEADDELQSYYPHVVGGLQYTDSLFGVLAVAAYDSNNEEFAGKLRVDVTPNEDLRLFVMGGYKTDDGDDEEPSLNNSDGTNYYGNWRGGDDDDDGGNGGDGYAIWAGGSYNITPTASLNALVSYDEGEDFGAVLNVDFQPVPGLHIQPEIAYGDNFDDDNDVDFDGDGDDDGDFGATLRFQRNF